MSGSDKIIFAFGLLATLLLFSGLLFTIREFREIRKHSERFAQEPDFSWITGEEPVERGVVKKR
jgi:hypothetical protein